MSGGDILTHRIDGEGEPLLLLNGGMMSIAAWEAIAGPLHRHHRVLRCDFRGQMLSPGAPHREMEDNVRDLVALPRFGYMLDMLYFPAPSTGVKGHTFELFLQAPELPDPVFVRFEVR